MKRPFFSKIIIVRGGGDIASGTIAALHRVGFRVLVLETECPSAIRRTVSFSEAIYAGETVVEGLCAKKIDAIEDAYSCWSQGLIPVLVDPQMDAISYFDTPMLIDATLRKRGEVYRGLAICLSIALGPGFEAGTEVDIVIETQRGHNLGRIIHQGRAIPNTGVPGLVAGVSYDRVLYAQESGVLSLKKDIGDIVSVGETIARIGDEPVLATIDGLLRGILPHGYGVKKGLKIADIDPRVDEAANCYSISEKARCIGGAVLEAVLVHLAQKSHYIR